MNATEKLAEAAHELRNNARVPEFIPSDHSAHALTLLIAEAVIELARRIEDIAQDIDDLDVNRR
jgi:hypothetical protein